MGNTIFKGVGGGKVQINKLLFFYVMLGIVSSGNLHTKSNGIIARSIRPPREEFFL